MDTAWTIIAVFALWFTLIGIALWYDAMYGRRTRQTHTPTMLVTTTMTPGPSSMPTPTPTPMPTPTSSVH